jgi:hypothetical protein
MAQEKKKNNDEETKKNNPLYSVKIDEFLNAMATLLGILHGGALVAGVNTLDALAQVILVSLVLYLFERWTSRINAPVFKRWVSKMLQPIQSYLMYIILHIVGRMFFTNSSLISILALSRPIVLISVLAAISVILEDKVG